MTDITRYQYNRMLARFADYLVARGDQVNPAMVREFLASLTPASGHTAYGALRLALPDLDWRGIPHPRAQRNEAMLQATLLDDADLVRARAVATRPKDRALLELFWTLRRVETTRVKWGAVNLSDGTIRVVRKGGREKWTLLPDSAQVALAEWFISAGQPPDEAFIFTGRFRGAMHPDSVGNLVRKLLRRAGVYRRGRGAHAFRRSLATRYLMANPEDLAGLSRLLGHEQLSTTMGYVYMKPEQLRPRLDRVRL